MHIPLATVLIAPSAVLARVIPFLAAALVCSVLYLLVKRKWLRRIVYIASLGFLICFLRPLFFVYPTFRGFPHFEGAFIFLMNRPLCAIPVYLAIALVALAPVILWSRNQSQAVAVKAAIGIPCTLLVLGLAITFFTLPIWSPDFVVQRSPWLRPLVYLWVERCHDNALERISKDFRAEAIPAFTALLGRRGSVGIRVADGLLALGPEGMQTLIDALEADDREVRWRATISLGVQGVKAKDAVPGIVRILEDPDHNLRRDAAEALGRIGPAAEMAIPALVERLKRDPESTVRQFAARALGRMGPQSEQVVLALTLALKDRSESVREWAAEALERIEVGNQ